MRLSATHTDEAILAEIGDRLGRTRLSRNLTQGALARDAGVSKRTVERMEAGESVQLTSFLRVLRALDLLEGLEALLPRARPGPIELLRTGGQPRQRASGGGPEDRSARPWSWGDTRGQGEERGQGDEDAGGEEG